ncbi:MAG TPA: ATP-binding protein [Thermoanaerobaculia bacterium]|jgi:signal transduction histidine kinase/CheY-like chemotaxis protein|nr:ATP-binding protein [Thermoanaerobaculia bacterium]
MAFTPLSSISLHFEYDLVAARRRARQIASLLGFDDQDQTRIATVASEISRNALRYGGGGRIEFGIDRSDGSDAALSMTVSDRGPGIPNLDDVLSGRYQSQSGMGVGLVGARRLMDDLQIHTAPGTGTTVLMKKRLRPSAPILDTDGIRKLTDELARQRPENPLEEIQQQNGELLHALGQLNERQEELERLNQELEDTNRGVLALYAELDEKAESLRRADQVKTRFLSDMSHEFRTPVNSILALARLIEEQRLTDEGKKQLALIHRAAGDLESLVNDLLDLAKIEAGKIDVRAAEFEVANLFSALRGMLRPLLLNRTLSLVFEEVEGLPPMYSDEGKVSQILRNFISNAMKFTEGGEVRVSASQSNEMMSFCVSDTGIGIAPEDMERIFDEFTQIENPIQRTQKGTGLGLPLTRKLATLLGGRVGVRSAPGAGSTFWAEIPIRYDGPDAHDPVAPIVEAAQPLRILIVDDDETARYTLASFATRPGVEIIEAENGLHGIARALSDHPDIIMLDLMMPGIGGHEVLSRLKSDPATINIPVVIVTSRFVNEAERQQILTRASNVVYKGDLSRETVSRAIAEALL